jgi:hypothetical protein
MKKLLIKTKINNKKIRKKMINHKIRIKKHKIGSKI